MQQDLFQTMREKNAPLADRMRPNTLDEFIGQEHIVGQGRLLRRAIELDRLQSSIFFGPPGTGKTTLAHIIANTTGAAFFKLNAVTAGVKDVRGVIDKAQEQLSLYGKPSYLLLDECHRWSKAQSDSILPALERGTIRFIGSTTENPMIAMTSAIVSRCRVFQFLPLRMEHVERAIKYALSDSARGLGAYNAHIDDDALLHICRMANGDCRTALNALELAVLTTPSDDCGRIRITLAIAEESVQRKFTPLDDQLFYDMLSAFCKSMRGSDTDAALIWFSRLLEAGADPRIIARRVIVHASEDVGMANPSALVQAVCALTAFENIGMPEGRLALAQAVIYVCESPKSNSLIRAVDAAMSDAKNRYDMPVPKHLCDTHYMGHEGLGAGAGYLYPHDFPDHWVKQNYKPADMQDTQYYEPGILGNEKAIFENHKRRKDFGRKQGE